MLGLLLKIFIFLVQAFFFYVGVHLSLKLIKKLEPDFFNQKPQPRLKYDGLPLPCVVDVYCQGRFLGYGAFNGNVLVDGVLHTKASDAQAVLDDLLVRG